MIHHQGSPCREERKNIRGGDGEVILHHRFEQAGLHGKCRLCAELVIEPGCGIGEYAHVDDMEIFYVLEGEVTSYGVDGAEEPFRKGDVMVTGSGERHCLRNNTDKRAVLFAVIAL